MKLFEEDREEWTKQIIQQLKEGKLNEIDRVNLIVALTEMSFERSRAIAFLENLQDKICEHLLCICALPDSKERNHWIVELEAWRKKLALLHSKKKTYSQSMLTKKFWDEPFGEEDDLLTFFSIMDKDKQYKDLKQAIEDDSINKTHFKAFVLLFVKSILENGSDTATIFSQWHKPIPVRKTRRK